MSDYRYENLRRIIYGDDENGYSFVPVCPKCGRFVKADETCFIHDTDKPNATCAKCGRVRMRDEGYLE